MAKDNNKNETDFLLNYNPALYQRPNTTVDTVIFTILDDALHVLTIKRDEHPFRHYWSLVGGFIDINKDQDLESTAKRKLEEKTGVKTPYLEQFETIGNKKRDPRGWSVTTIYFALIPYQPLPLQPDKGAMNIKWSKIVKGKIKESLAFDHADILSRCYERLRSKVLYTSLPVYLMQKDFTLGELQKIYEIILDKKIDHKSFRRRILSADILEETEKMKQIGKKPARVFRIKNRHNIHFFVRNIEGAA